MALLLLCKNQMLAVEVINKLLKVVKRHLQR